MHEVRRRGKHFMDDAVLQALNQARLTHAAHRSTSTSDELLSKFFDVVLDKVDHTYDYLTYTALPILQHSRPELSDEPHPSRLQHAHDAAICSIIADALDFEQRVLAGGVSYLPNMRPDIEMVERRTRFALRSIEPALRRLGHFTSDETPLGPRVGEVVDFCRQQALAHSPFILNVSMMPVYIVHDEYLFLRILQSLDATFASVATLLKSAIRSFDAAPQQVATLIQIATVMLQEGLKHFQTLSTMQKESFSTFREFTTGASAIQSVNYKITESLCRKPDRERLDSLAYSSVPELQKDLQSGGEALDDKLIELRRNPSAGPELLRAVENAMRGLSEIMIRWRHSHFGIAKKYLGDETGTGSSDGLPYLKKGKDIPVFNSLSVDVGNGVMRVDTI